MGMRFKVVIIFIALLTIPLSACDRMHAEKHGNIKNTPDKYSDKIDDARCRDAKSDIYSGGKFGKRTTKSIQSHMNIRKFDVYSAYRQATKDDPNLEGTICLKLTISSNGDVESSGVKYSELNSPEFEKYILMIMNSIDFGKYDVPRITILYPLHFIPKKNRDN